METYQFSEEEIALIKNRFRRLDLVSPTIWSGVLDFESEYNGNVIQDEYKIEIIIPVKYPAAIPIMREVGGRSEAVAKKYEITDLRNLHRNQSNGSSCLCVRQEEQRRFPPGSNLLKFIDDLAIPYLYGLSYFDEHGRWPWGDYSHGGLGLLEFYSEDPIEQTREGVEELSTNFRLDDNWREYSKQIRKPSPDKPCICHSGIPFQKCHYRAWLGLLRICTDIKRLGLNSNKLFQHQYQK